MKAKFFVLLTTIISCVFSCSPKKGIIYSTFSVNPKVKNGTAFERAEIDVANYETIIIPNKAEVKNVDTGVKTTIYMKKTLSFAGHPLFGMDIKKVRKYMGCAWNVKDDQLMIGTYGEWDSIEGGAHIELEFYIPDKLVIKRDSALAGQNSIVNSRKESTLIEWLLNGYWYGSTGPNQDWTKLSSKLDARYADRHIENNDQKQ